jgi:hypothetical protein
MLVLDWLREKGQVNKDPNLEPFENLPKCSFDFSVSEWANKCGENNDEKRRRFYEVVNVLEGLNLVKKFKSIDSQVVSLPSVGKKKKQMEIDSHYKSHTWIGDSLDITINKIWVTKSQQNKKKVLSKEEANNYSLIKQA